MSLDKQIKVSVLIASYNAETYINECMKAKLDQTLDSFEVIVVDDGSSDGSANLWKEWAVKDERICILHTKHKGVAHSRQLGLEQARGEYILYVDADDRIASGMIADMYQKAVSEKADIVICDYLELTHDGEVYRKQQPTLLSGVAILEDILEGRLYGALWNKMMQREWLLQTKATFPQGLTMREDLIFLSRCLPYASKIAYIPKAYYGYERRNTSALTNRYVDESPFYYEQECLWVDLILENQFLRETTRRRLQGYLLTLAYITLKKNLFDKQKWETTFLKHPEILTIGTGYKKSIVGMAFNGHFDMAQRIRTLISRLKS